jgi:hypothetical protein
MVECFHELCLKSFRLNQLSVTCSSSSSSSSTAVIVTVLCGAELCCVQQDGGPLVTTAMRCYMPRQLPLPNWRTA